MRLLDTNFAFVETGLCACFYAFLGENRMKILEDRILKEGKVLPGGILKVGSFMNHQIDPGLMAEMGKEIYRLFKDSNVTKILTIESSGIAMALAVAMNFNVPMVFAKKSMTSNVSGEVYKAAIHSFTHGNDFTAIVPADYILASDTVLIVDDFLATGNAINGLVEIVEAAGAKLAGAAAGIEKVNQGGGNELRNRGIRVESMAMIDSMTDTSITFRN